MLNQLFRVKIFIKLNLRDIYYKLYIKQGNKWKTAFKTQYSHFKYLVMPFRLTNISTTLQLYIYRALGELVNYIYIIYLNNILIYLEDKD
jgi:hypothetical protein